MVQVGIAQLQPNKMKHPLRQTLSIWIAKASFVVKINFLGRDCISEQFEPAYGGFVCGRIF